MTTEAVPDLPEIEIPDLNLPGLIEIRDSVLNLEDVPDKAAIILALTALGFSASRIAKILDCSRQAIDAYVHRYDPKGLCRVSDDDRRILTTQMLGVIAVAALMEISQEKLTASNAKDLAAIASRCATTAETLNAIKKNNRQATPDRMIAMMDALDVIEVE